VARRVVTSRGRAVRIEGLPELQDKLADLIDRATAKEVKKIWMQAALELRDEARNNAPVAKEPIKHYEKGETPRLIMPGALKSAIFAAYGAQGKQDVLVGVNYKIAPHAHWLEFGNSRIPPQPYMRPAITATRSTIVAIIADGYRKLLIEGGTIPEPSSRSGPVPVPNATSLARSRQRIIQRWQQRRKR
jgi:HK97 gp10 family phage protein